MLFESGDAGHEFSHRSERAAPNGLLRDDVEPDLDLVEPGGVGRREVRVIPRAGRQPAPDRRVFVARRTRSCGKVWERASDMSSAWISGPGASGRGGRPRPMMPSLAVGVKDNTGRNRHLVEVFKGPDTSRR